MSSSGSQAQEVVGEAFLLDGLLYASLAGGSLVQFVRNSCRYQPWTVQKMIHLLMFLSTTIRCVFLVLVAFDWCDALSGEIGVTSCSPLQRDLFYVMDQLPIVGFFVIYALLMQFWAEVYYNAIDKLNVLSNYAKPTIRVFIGGVLLIQVSFWVCFATVWKYERAFFTKSQAILNMLMFLFVTSGFLYYGRNAYIELRNVPVEVGIRSRKLKELAGITTVCTSFFLARCVVQVCFATDPRQLHERFVFLYVLLYYAVLEICPCVAILYFNRRLPTRRTRRAENDSRRAVGSRFFLHRSGPGHDGGGSGGSNDSLRKSLLHSTK